MTKNPFYNALCAYAYVMIVVTIINVATRFAGPGPDNNFLAPMAMLSLLTLSAATMGFLFFYQPLTMILDGKRKEAVSFFLRSVALFAVLTFGTFVAAFFIFQK